MRSFLLIVVYFVSSYLAGLAIRDMFTEDGKSLGMIIAMAIGFAAVGAAGKMFPAEDES